MEAGNILSADVLDIIFDARNKEYGAYDLRKNYQRRLVKALLTTFLIVVLLLVAYLLASAVKPKTNNMVTVKDLDLVIVPNKPKPEQQIVVPPAKQMELPKERMIKDMVPIIVKDDVPIDEPVPEQKDFDNAKIGNATTEGAGDDGIVGPPAGQDKGVYEPSKKREADDSIFRSVEIEAQYPGGMRGWGDFLYRNMQYPQNAIDQEIQGTVYIEFIVDIHGKVSNVHAISGPEELLKAAEEVIIKSIKWNPAIQNGRAVNSYKKQPITFKLME